MAKYTKREVKEIIQNTPKELKGIWIDDFPYSRTKHIGSYQPSSCPQTDIYMTVFDGKPYQIAVYMGYSR